jgi:hypothetical protein
MDDSEATSLEQIRVFLAGSREVRFTGQLRDEVYAWTERTLVRHQYASLSKREKGLLRLYLGCMTGLSRAQVTRLIAGYAATGRVKAAPHQRRKFAARYTKADVELLAYVDKSHGNLSGPATRRILEREYREYGQAAYAQLAGISVAQIYRFRNSESYRKRNTSYQPTRPTPIAIGERRKPRPQGRPGYLRIDIGTICTGAIRHRSSHPDAARQTTTHGRNREAQRLIARTKGKEEDLRLVGAPPQTPGFIAFGPEWMFSPLPPKAALPYYRTAWEEDRATQGCDPSAVSDPEWMAAPSRLLLNKPIPAIQAHNPPAWGGQNSSQNQNRKESLATDLPPSVQAHPSLRKCC